MPRRAGGPLLLALVLLLGACSSGGSERSSSRSQPSHRATLEIRPIRALLPPGDPTVPAGSDRVVEPTSGNGLRYAVGPAALSGPIVRRAGARDLGGTGQSWIVDVELTPAAARQLETLGRRLAEQPPPQNGVAVVVDGAMEGEMTFEPPVAELASVHIAGTLSGRRARELAASLSP